MSAFRLFVEALPEIGLAIVIIVPPVLGTYLLALWYVKKHPELEEEDEEE